MKQYIFHNLIVEVTRRCNMKCDHCLRGCAQNVDMSRSTVRKLLNRTESIINLTITGGEPVLNAKLIIYLLDNIMRLGIEVGSFFMATNGGVFDKELYYKIIDFYQYVYEPQFSYVCVSSDQYHDGAISEYVGYWKSLRFYSDMKETNYDYMSIIDEGTANEYGIGYRQLIIPEYLFVSDEELEFIDYFYVNANGDITNHCDMSYETQEFNNFGNISDIDKIFKEQLKLQYSEE